MVALKILVWVTAMVLGLATYGGLFAIALPFWLWWSVHRGLRLRTGRPVAVRVDTGRVHVTLGAREEAFALHQVVSARMAENGNWTESKLVDDALTLRGAHGRRLVKIPRRATGFEDLERALVRLGIPVEHVVVDAPAYLD